MAATPPNTMDYSFLTDIPGWHFGWLIPAIAVLAIFSLTLATNLLTLPRLRPSSTAARPLVSVLIPARNEAHRIGATVSAILAQQYAHFELLILDDQSEDGTAEVVTQLTAADPRCRLLSGESLPAGWLGKNWACHQLATAAKGDLFLFIDADVTLAPAALGAIVQEAIRQRADLLAVWPTQLLSSLSERILVPLINFVILNYVSVLAIHHSPQPIFAAANGQCLLFRPAAYWGIGGHRSVQANVLEDVALARECKRRGFRLRLVTGDELISCRMYTNWPDIRDGFAKNLLAGFGNSPLALLAAGLLHWLLFVWPWLAALLGAGWLAFGVGLWGIGLRAISAWRTRNPVGDALSLPIAVSMMSYIAWRSYRWSATGRNQWKGRLLNGNSS